MVHRRTFIASGMLFFGASRLVSGVESEGASPGIVASRDRHTPVQQLDSKVDRSGRSDVTREVQALIDEAKGANLMLPSGRYRISKPLKLPSDMHLSGVGSSTVLVSSMLNKSFLVCDRQSQVSISNLRLEAESAFSEPHYSGIWIRESTDVLVDRVEFAGFSWAGVSCRNCARIRVHNCYMHSWLHHLHDSGDVVLYDCNECSIIGNRLFGGGWHGVLIQDPTGLGKNTNHVVASNDIGNHSAYGIAVYEVNPNDTNVRIINNRISNISGDNPNGAGGAGIYIVQATGNLVHGNRISRCCLRTRHQILAPAGISIARTGADMLPNQVTDNEITEMGGFYGIFVVGAYSGTTVDGNSIRNSEESKIGIFALDSSSVQITNNKIFLDHSDGQRGIFVRRVRGESGATTVHRNTVSGDAYASIQVSGDTLDLSVSDVNVSSNVIRAESAKSRPILISNARRINLTGNSSSVGVPIIRVEKEKDVTQFENNW